jgi:acyl transferase domain-containing protein/SAM-dependent methyltransferase/acyl carrier protein
VNLSEIDDEASQGVAIVGMASRFPGVKNIEEFWQILRAGVEAIAFFSEEELISLGVDPILLKNPNYVKAKGVLADIELFDAAFFGFSPREAELTDPQQRVFLECAWSALENAGYNPETYPGTVGVYAGAGWNSYLLFNLASHPHLLESEIGHQTLLGNEKDNLCTRVSYKLNLKGPSITVQTGCSTSLVAAALAYQGLLTYQCDMALAGGVSITVPQTGYLYQSGGIFSPDGHCRAFDAKAQGTVVGSGAGVVVLKRLEEAIADGDYIYAVIKAAAINNDGSQKAGYTAPSIEGQARAIVEAQAMAEVQPQSITYIEAHGTATSLGDPIEVAALTKAFRTGTAAKGFCAIGSVKTNIGHLDAAAGVAGLIKTALALKHKEIPPSLHFEKANPKIDFASSPFYVNTSLAEWEANGDSRRAGVSSFGLGGTNAHLILEEAPAIASSTHEKSQKLLVFSARTSEALENFTTDLASHLRQRPEVELADVAYTLQVGRKAFTHRRALVCDDANDAAAALEARDPQRVLTQVSESSAHGVVFMFSGQGSQYVNMAREIYQAEPTFRLHANICFDLLKSKHDLNLRQILYPSDEYLEESAERLKQTENAQPALFVIEYALAQMWMSWGIPMRAAIGHSIGEYVAATIAGVFSIESALSLVAARGRLIQSLPGGAMLAIPLSEQEVVPLLGSSLSLAAINGPSSCVVSGPVDAVEALEQQLASKGIDSRRLHTSHAFHSEMMEPVLKTFGDHLKQVRFTPPHTPYISNVTGTWITASEATDPNYWVGHLRQTVRFADGLTRLMTDTRSVLLEVGPGRTLSQLARRHPCLKDGQAALSSLHHPQEGHSDSTLLLKTLGQLWLSGVEIDWSKFYRNQQRHRLPLPTYAFDRQRYWIEPATRRSAKELWNPAPTTQELWQTLVNAVQIQANAEIASFDQHNHLKNKACLDELCIAYIKLTLLRLGAFNHLGESYSLEGLLAQCQIIPRYHQLFSRWLQVLVEAGQLQQDEAGLLTHLLPYSADSIAALAQEARVRWAHTPQVVDLVQHCGEALKDVLLGNQDPLELFSTVLDGSAEKSQPEFGLHTHYKTILRSGLEGLVKSLPPSTKLRILEIGGGTGIATTELLPILPPEQTSYTFTDVAKLFLLQARQKFGAYPFVTYGLLDIEKSPAGQGYPLQAFDVIIAVNVLHAAREINQTLAYVRSLLAPGGLLLIGEITQPTLDFAITYGLLMNPVEDAERNQGNPFLTAERWRAVLRAHDFIQAGAFPDNDVLGQHALIAQVTTVALQMPSSSSKDSVQQAFTCSLASPDQDRDPSPQKGLLKKADIADWFYVPSWKRSSRPQPAKSSELELASECWMIFVDQCGLGNRLIERLERQGHDVVRVEAGERFHRESFNRFAIDPRQQGDYDTLLQELLTQNKVPGKIVHLWSVTHGSQSELTMKSLEYAQSLGIHSLLFLAQAIGTKEITDTLQMWVLSSGLQEVTDDEISIEKSLLLAPCKVIPLEYPNINCTSVDVLISTSEDQQYEQLADQILEELQSDGSDRVVAYRGSHRWVQTIETIRLNQPVSLAPRLKKNGIYLITGGLGKVGLTVAGYLAKAAQAKLILTRRSAFPQPEEWEQWLRAHSNDDPCSRIIQNLLELEALGSEVMVVTADVADLEQMQAAISQAQARFGAINGVIHSAGVLGDGAIQHKTLLDLKNVLAPKVAGTIVLDTIFKDVTLDFLILFSSLSAIKPGFGQVAYSAANNFLDAFAHSRLTRRHQFTSCINWDVWQGEGMAYDANTPLALRRLKEEDFKQRGILPEEGIDVFNRILGSTLPHVLVSTSDYLNVMKTRKSDLSQLYMETLRETTLSSQNHPRPNLSSDYALPQDEAEETLAEIWQELLGIDRIGVNDDFFELGGDSLIGTQLITRVKRGFGVQLSTRTVYSHPTIRSMSEAVVEALVSQSSPEKISEILKGLALGD